MVGAKEGDNKQKFNFTSLLLLSPHLIKISFMRVRYYFLIYNVLEKFNL